MSKEVIGNEYYRENPDTIAVKWQSPEVLQYGRFSHASGNSFYIIIQN